MSSAEARQINHLAGLRGWAALLVFFTHVRDVFGNDLRRTVHDLFADSRIFGPVMDALYSATFDAGQFAVYTFWILSGYVLSLSYFRLRSAGKTEMFGSWARQHVAGRYFRLYLPILAVCFLVFLLAHLHLFQNAHLSQALGPASDTARFYVDFSPSLWDTLWFALVQCPFEFMRHFDPPLWTIGYELWGSLLVFTLLALFGSQPKRWLVYLVAAVVLSLLQPIYLSFILGLALADVHTSWPREKLPIYWLPVPAVTALLIWGEVLHFPQATLVGAACLLLVTVYGPTLFKRFLSCRFSVFLGDISYGLYLIHYILLCTLGGALYFWLVNLHFSRGVATTLAVALVIPPLFLLSWLFHRWIDLPATALAKQIGRRFS